MDVSELPELSVMNADRMNPLVFGALQRATGQVGLGISQSLSQTLV
jgi:hypothetical protein